MNFEIFIQYFVYMSIFDFSIWRDIFFCQGHITLVFLVYVFCNMISCESILQYYLECLLLKVQFQVPLIMETTNCCNINNITLQKIYKHS